MLEQLAFPILQQLGTKTLSIIQEATRYAALKNQGYIQQLEVKQLLEKI